MEQIKDKIFTDDDKLKEMIEKIGKAGRYIRLKSNLHWLLDRRSKFPKVKALDFDTVVLKSNQAYLTEEEKNTLKCYICHGLVVVPVGFYNLYRNQYSVHPNLQLCLGCGLELVAGECLSEQDQNHFKCPVINCNEVHMLVVGEWSECAEKVAGEIIIYCSECGKQMNMKEFAFHKLAKQSNKCFAGSDGGIITVDNIAAERNIQSEQSWMLSRTVQLLNGLRVSLLNTQLNWFSAYNSIGDNRSSSAHSENPPDDIDFKESSTGPDGQP